MLLLTVVVDQGYDFVALLRLVNVLVSFFFFFQAEDGIRDLTVTGVQTCALPIFLRASARRRAARRARRQDRLGARRKCDRRGRLGRGSVGSRPHARGPRGRAEDRKSGV